MRTSANQRSDNTSFKAEFSPQSVVLSTHMMPSHISPLSLIDSTQLTSLSSHGTESQTQTPTALSCTSSTFASMSALQCISLVSSTKQSIKAPIRVEPSSNITCILQPAKRKSTTQTYRKGKWSKEEEAYANAVIREFDSGYLDAPAGITLRTYLSEKLDCSPMRITKKFTGNGSIGKRVFQPVNDRGVASRGVQATLGRLYQQWKERLLADEQESARKSLAVANVVSRASSLNNARDASALAVLSSQFQRPATDQMMSRNAISKTASWLGHAANILSNNDSKRTHNSPTTQCETEKEMKLISRLIEEGLLILATARELPRIVQKQRVDSNQLFATNCPMKLLASLSSQAKPVQVEYESTGLKRLDEQSANYSHIVPKSNKRFKPDSTTVQDAKIFVSFLQSMAA